MKPDDPNFVLKQILDEIKAMRKENREAADSQKRWDRLSPKQKMQAEAVAMKNNFANGRELINSFHNDEFEEWIEDRGEKIGRQGGGPRGFARSILEAQMPDPKEALGIYGYQQAIRGSRASKAYALAEMFRGSLAPNAPIGADPYTYSATGDVTGLRAYSGGNFSDLSRSQQAALYQAPEFARRVQGISEEEVAAMSRADRVAYKQYMAAGAALLDPNLSAAERGEHHRLRNIAALRLGSRIFAQGESLQEFASASPAAASAVQELGGMGGRMGTALGFGFRGAGLVMAGARLAGPVGMAIQAAETAYRGADALYGPTRQAAALGYGFSYNPINYGAQVAMGRSLETQATALTSFGINGQQALAARRTLEGIGVGGPGNERMYNSMYSSMTDVIKGTQLNAQELAPFYEQFVRSGGQPNEVSQLTKMLRDDLPKAAAAARMSLSEMAQSIAQTSAAASQSPLNTRTQFQLSQTITNSMMAGAPKGTEGIAAGQNDYLAARVASNQNMSFLQAREQGGLMQAEAASVLQDIIGNMSGDQFQDFRQTDEGRMKTMIASQMTGMTVEQMQQLFETGLGKYQNAQTVMNAVDPSRFRTKDSGSPPKSNSQMLGEKVLAGSLNTAIPGAGFMAEALGLGKQNEDKRSSVILGSGGIDIYKASGKVVSNYYEKEGVLDKLRSSLNEEDLQKFNEDLASLSEDKGNKVVDLIKDTAQKVTKTEDNKNGPEVLGLFDLSDDAKKLIKFTASVANPGVAVSDLVDWGAPKFKSLLD